jgi:hypothetical protein
MTRLPLVFAFALAVVIVPISGFAQTPSSPPPQGPLVVERIHSNFVVAPDYKVTELDGDVAHLAGGYAGWLTDNTLFLGGALYSVANGSDDFGLTYGGLVAGWTLFPERRVQFGTRGLVGVGRAGLGTDIEFARFGRGGRGSRGGPRLEPVPQPIRFQVEDDFFVFEPQLTVVTKVTNHISINVGAGYRVTAYAERLGDRVNGAAGTVALQFGGF